MAFLRQCLQALRAQQGDPDAHFLNDPEWLEECGKTSFHDEPFSARYTNSSTHQLIKPIPDASNSTQIKKSPCRRD